MSERAQQYRFLASVYLTPPDATFLEALSGHGLLEAPVDLKDAVQEFNNLFVVPLGQYTTPYEAVFRDEREVAGKMVRGMLMGPSTLDVIAHYKQAGIKVDTSVGELPDHIGVELAFMEHLCRREAELNATGDVGQVRDMRVREHAFLKKHLTQWVPLLSRTIQEKARIPLYKTLARLTESAVADDFADLEGGVTPC